MSRQIRSVSLTGQAATDYPPGGPPPFYEDPLAGLTASLSRHPSTPGETVLCINDGAQLWQLERDRWLRIFSAAKVAASLLKIATKAVRVALVTTADDQLQLIPLHGLDGTWQPVTCDELEECRDVYPGYITSRSAARIKPGDLSAVQARITSSPDGIDPIDATFHGDSADKHLFARIVRGEEEQWRLWQSPSHVAFLTPFGNTPGFTVLIPRKHLDSDIFALPDAEYRALVDALYDVAALLRRKLHVPRAGIVFEGMELDYAHAKLIPIYEQAPGASEKSPPQQTYKQVYEGYVSSQPGPEAVTETLLPLTVALQVLAAQ
ncbi:hypothetical protein L228DRAFT_76990 [Xylona heveae TC161]|uniref:HIT domain-containing protein n=1 Tax=Xylona heveae (strain CBS 132557 / TC161) TaxID=1328760 RepID=A0A165IW70_XYLHT|nr:hypothetical protein L228DRAFT_76990 [Xylona heveae TC161]KZF25465.1 hypothetical protein L228DRAFT_76990 [Xylona heveae TC161]